jgi:hypothetical protein
MDSNMTNAPEPTQEERRRDNLRRYIALAWRIYHRRRSLKEAPGDLDESIQYPYDPDRKVDEHHQ